MQTQVDALVNEGVGEYALDTPGAVHRSIFIPELFTVEEYPSVKIAHDTDLIRHCTAPNF